MLVATALRRLGQIDAVLARCMDRPLGAKAQAAQDLLRLGAAQLLYLDTPAHAAVDTSVGLAAEGEETAGFKALINAVLRRIGREKNELLKATAAPRAQRAGRGCGTPGSRPMARPAPAASLSPISPTRRSISP